MIVLGIETSCDETAAAIVQDDKAILSNEIYSQVTEHQDFGGVVPEIAARAHSNILHSVIRRALKQAGVKLPDLGAIAATGGPGLIGGVIVGTVTAKAIAAAVKRPFLAINHLEGHALTARLTDNVDFPYLLLLVSGGHCQLLIVNAPGEYQQIGTTLDDAVGEAFDKCAKMLGLDFPGGPALENAAMNGNEKRFNFPRPMKGRKGCDFSFSGLKTAARHAIKNQPGDILSQNDIQDIAASFQEAIADVLTDRCANAFITFNKEKRSKRVLVAAGGVAANSRIRKRLSQLCECSGFSFIAPPPNLCTDNAAMIAWAGIERLQQGMIDDFNFIPRPRWPLEELDKNFQK